MWTVYIPRYDETIEADSITMDFRLNAVSTAQISFTEFLVLPVWSKLTDMFVIGDPIQIKYKDQVVFNGFVYQANTTKTQTGYQLNVTLQDPLGKLVKLAYKGGFSGKLQDLIETEICPYINIKNRIQSDAIVNLRYEKEVTRFSLLHDACAIARYQTNPASFGFYYNHRLNALCELNDPEAQEPLVSISNRNRLSINQSHGYIIANIVQVRNY